MQLVNWVNSNGIASSAAAWSLGVACAHIPAIVRYVVFSKPVMAMIKKNPDVARAIAAELSKDVDEVASQVAGAPHNAS